MNGSGKQVYEFDGFRLELEERLLLRNGHPVALTPKVFDTLVLLVQNSGHLLLKDELMKKLWPGSFVEEVNLSQNVSILRKTLGEMPNERRYIATVPGKGYRFVAAVKELTNAASPADDLLVSSYTRSRVTIEEAQEDRTAAGALGAPQNRPHRAWKLSVTVLVLLVITAGVLLIFRSSHRKQPASLRNSDSILVADFTNTTGDPVFEGALKQALTIDLEQSPNLNIVPETKVQESLRLMGRPRDTSVTTDIGREICQRSGIKALVTGSIAALGARYVIALRAIDPAGGNALATAKADASSKEQVLAALDRAEADLRRRLGDAFTAGQRFAKPLEQVTTRSLQALQAYSVGDNWWYRGELSKAVPFYERAIQLDPDFAMAYARIGVARYMAGEPELAAEFSQKAFTRRARASEPEQFYITAHYYNEAVGDFDKALETFQVYRQTYPLAGGPVVDFSSMYNAIGEFETTLRNEEEILGNYPDTALTYLTAAEACLALNRLDHARNLLEQAVQRNLGGDDSHLYLYAIGAWQSDQGLADREQHILEGSAEGTLALRSLQANLAASHGQLRRALALLSTAEDLARSLRQNDLILSLEVRRAFLENLVGHRRAAHRLASAVAAHITVDEPMRLSLPLAWAGQESRMLELLEGRQKSRPKDTFLHVVWTPAVRALLQLRRGDAAQAVETLKGAARYDRTQTVVIFTRATAYLKAGMGTQAAQEFTHLRRLLLLDRNSPLPTFALLGLARAYALQGDTARSRAAYREFLEIWKDADADNPVLKQAKAEYLRLP